ncbi:ABC transporter permease [Nocardioides albidus]|uniref:ABC transporter permease n=1 Tax=Nocardioides albidus TaxID=1517589 RepID=A0A5C4VMX0_9ACTN|nr:ABC transporter permease [Nocardioides albidus]TNM36519.1 ABC transporter permease [Nocardioides albidus]
MSTPSVTDSVTPTPAGGGAARRGRSPWAEFAVKRALGLLGTMVVLVLLTFFIVRLIPGDPAVQVAGSDATAAQVEAARHQLGLDKPLWQQLGDYVGGLLRGDLGDSFSMRGSVRDVVLSRLWFTGTIAFVAMAVVLLLAVPLGMAVGILTRGGRRRWLDRVFTVLTGLVAAVPSYVMATLLILLFPVTLALLFPAYSELNPTASLVLPVLSLAVGPIMIMARVVRREIAVVLEQDFMRTARGWRLGTLRLYGKYAFPSLMTSTLTLSGLILTAMLGSAIVVETVFSVPGLGLGLVRAILAKDYPVIQGIVLILGIIAALLTLAIDTILGIIDPRTLGGRHA